MNTEPNAHGRRARDLAAAEIAHRLIVSHAELQAALGRALKGVRRLREEVKRTEPFSAPMDQATVIIRGRLELIGACASELARDVVQLSDLLNPPASESPEGHWREVLRRGKGEAE